MRDVLTEERERFIRLSPQEREKERAECLSTQLYKDAALTKKIDMVEYCTKGLYGRLHEEPTQEELARLKLKDGNK